MSSSIPHGFEDLYQASNRINGEVNIMGRVTDHLSPTPSRGTDLMSTFSIADASHSTQSEEGLKIRFFKPSEGEHPQIRGSGDVVLLRKVKIKGWKNVAMGISHFDTSWVVFPAAEIPVKAPQNRLMIKHIKSPNTAEPSHSEMLYAIELCNLGDRTMDIPSGIPISSTETPSTWTASSAGGPIDASASSSKTNGRSSYGRDKFSLVKDLHVNSFYDIVGQVVKMYSNFGRLELYVTDYTANNMLFGYAWGQDDEGNSKENDYNYGSTSAPKSKKWPGPYGQMTLMVTLWPPHSSFAQSKVNDWDFVLLQNVHVKQDRDGKMEGALHEDRFWPNKIQISVLRDHSDERVKNVLRRKLEYTEKFNAQSETLIREARKQNQTDVQGEKPLSKSAARRKRKLEREKQQAAATKEETSSKKQKKNQNPPKSNIPPDSPPPLPKAVPKATRTDLNKNVHCSHHTIPTTPLASILSLEPTHQTTTPNDVTYTLPFQNLKTRTTVRVVDFFPPDIADFAIRSRPKSEFDALSDYEGGSDSASESTDSANHDPEPGARKRTRTSASEPENWEWRFALVLEDAESAPQAAKKEEQKARITAYVAGLDGDFLLKEDAVDLHTNPNTLSSLREKLFLLWGDLEERKTNPDPGETPPRSKAFTCCLQEYGVRVRGGGGGRERGGVDWGEGREGVRDGGDDEGREGAGVRGDDEDKDREGAGVGGGEDESRGSEGAGGGDEGRQEGVGGGGEDKGREGVDGGEKDKGKEGAGSDGEAQREDEHEQKWERKWRMFGTTII